MAEEEWQSFHLMVQCQFNGGEVTIIPFNGMVALYGRGGVAAIPFDGAVPFDGGGGVVTTISFDGAVAFDSGEGCVLGVLGIIVFTHSLYNRIACRKLTVAQMLPWIHVVLLP